MVNVVFILLGILDVLALFALMFTAFRLPYFEYIWEIGIIALVTSLASFLVRVYFTAPALLDVGLHFILYILFFRYLIKVRVWRALVISLMYFGYGVISASTYAAYSKTGVIDPNSMGQTGSFLVQITQIIVSFCLSYLLYKFKLGFSFIIRPPHDFFIKTPFTKNELIIVAGVLSMACAIALTFTHSQHFMVIPLDVVVFIILLCLAYRRDRKNDRSH